MSEQWTTDRAAADPAGALAWCASQEDKCDLRLIAIEVTALRALVRELVSLARLSRNMAGHRHWDATMQHGAGCPLCIEQRAILGAIDTSLAKVPADLKE